MPPFLFVTDLLKAVDVSSQCGNIYDKHIFSPQHHQFVKLNKERHSVSTAAAASAADRCLA
jgi:hypothetical protein